MKLLTIMVLLFVLVFFSCLWTGLTINSRFTALEERVQKIEQSHAH